MERQLQRVLENDPLRVTEAPRIPPTRARIALAFAVAITADILQLPIAIGFFASLLSVVGAPADIPLEAVDAGIDAVAAAATIALLGFHWILLPTGLIELIPGVDALPTWTACVAFVAWRRGHETRQIQ